MGPCDNGGKDGSDASTSQGLPRTASNHQPLGRHKQRPFSRAFGRSMARLTPWFQTSSLQNCENFCCLSCLICGSPSKLTQFPSKNQAAETGGRREWEDRTVHWEMLWWLGFPEIRLHLASPWELDLWPNGWPRCPGEWTHCVGLREVSKTPCKDPEFFWVTSVWPYG